MLLKTILTFALCLLDCCYCAAFESSVSSVPVLYYRHAGKVTELGFLPEGDMLGFNKVVLSISAYPQAFRHRMVGNDSSLVIKLSGPVQIRSGCTKAFINDNKLEDDRLEWIPYEDLAEKNGKGWARIQTDIKDKLYELIEQEIFVSERVIQLPFYENVSRSRTITGEDLPEVFVAPLSAYSTPLTFCYYQLLRNIPEFDRCLHRNNRIKDAMRDSLNDNISDKTRLATFMAPIMGEQELLELFYLHINGSHPFVAFPTGHSYFISDLEYYSGQIEDFPPYFFVCAEPGASLQVETGGLIFTEFVSSRSGAVVEEYEYTYMAAIVKKEISKPGFHTRDEYWLIEFRNNESWATEKGKGKFEKRPDFDINSLEPSAKVICALYRRKPSKNVKPVIPLPITGQLSQGLMSELFGKMAVLTDKISKIEENLESYLITAVQQVKNLKLESAGVMEGMKKLAKEVENSGKTENSP